MVSILSDISFDPRTRMGVAGILVVEDAQQKDFDDSLAVRLTLHQSTACTELEIKSVISAMEWIKIERLEQVTVFTDCKSAIDLLARRERLEASQYISKAKNQEHIHADLYREFFKIFDQTSPELRWIKGHKPVGKKSIVDSYFSYLDQTCRKALRAYLAED